MKFFFPVLKLEAIKRSLTSISCPRMPRISSIDEQSILSNVAKGLVKSEDKVPAIYNSMIGLFLGKHSSYCVSSSFWESKVSLRVKERHYMAIMFVVVVDVEPLSKYQKMRLRLADIKQLAIAEFFSTQF